MHALQLRTRGIPGGQASPFASYRRCLTFLSQAHLLHSRFPRIWKILWSCLRAGVTRGWNVTGHIFPRVPSQLSSPQIRSRVLPCVEVALFWLSGLQSLPRVLEPRCH